MCIDEVILVKLLIIECSSPMDNDKDRIVEQYFNIYNVVGCMICHGYK